MKVILLITISAVFVREVVPGAIMRHPRDLGPESETNERHPRDLANPLHSFVHTEYEANYQQKSQKGNQSFSTVKGKQEIVHDNCSNNWNEFAEKCAALIKDLVASLANAISSNPGDTTNLQLQIKNSFRHFDSTHNCSCFNGSDANIKKIGLELPLIFNRTSIPGTHGGNPTDANIHGGPNHGSKEQTSCSGSSCDQETTGSASQGGSEGSPSEKNTLPVFVLEPKEAQQDTGHGSLSGGTPQGTSESSLIGQPNELSSAAKGPSGKPNLPPYFLPLDYEKKEGSPVAGNHQYPVIAQDENGFQSPIASEGQMSHPEEKTQAFGQQPKPSGWEPSNSGFTEHSNGESTPSSGHGGPEMTLQLAPGEPVTKEGAHGEESDCNESGGPASSGSHATSNGEPTKTDSHSGQEGPMTVQVIPTNTHLGEEGGISPGTDEETIMPETSGIRPTDNKQLQVPTAYHTAGGSEIPLTPSDSLIGVPVSEGSQEGCENSQNPSETSLSVPEVDFKPIVEKPEHETTGTNAMIPAGAEGHPASTQLSANTPEREQIPVGVSKIPAVDYSETSQLPSSLPEAAHSVDPVTVGQNEDYGHPLILPQGHKPELPTAHEPPHVLIKPPTTDPSATSGGFQSISDSINGEPSGTLGGDSAEPLFPGAATHQPDTPKMPTAGSSEEPSQGYSRPVAQLPQSGTHSDHILGQGDLRPNSEPAIPPVETTEECDQEPSQHWTADPKQVAAAPQEFASGALNPGIDNGQEGHGMTTPQIPTTFQTTSVEPTQSDSLVLPTATTPTVSPHPTTLLLNQPDKSIDSSHMLTDLPAHNHHHGLEEGDDDDEDDDECCSCEACDEDMPNSGAFRKATCKDLQQAKRELKAIFDKIQKRLNCGRRTSKAITISPRQ